MAVFTPFVLPGKVKLLVLNEKCTGVIQEMDPTGWADVRNGDHVLYPEDKATFYVVHGTRYALIDEKDLLMVLYRQVTV